MYICMYVYMYVYVCMYVYMYVYKPGFPGDSVGKEPSIMLEMRRRRHEFNPWVGKIPWRRACNPLQYSCLENPHEQRSLVSYSP